MSLNITPSYLLDILRETAWAESVVPFGSNITFWALKGFGTAPLWPYALAAIIGSGIGYAFNWWLGAQLLRLKQRGALRMPERLYTGLQRWFEGVLLGFLALSWGPLLNLLPVFAAFAGVPFRKGFPIVMLGVAGYYGWQVLM